jgi:hypothetical protein
MGMENARHKAVKFILNCIGKRASAEAERLHGVDNPHAGTFVIQKGLKQDFGREVARMHWSHRPFATRYDVVRISNGNKAIYVPILGLDGDQNKGVAKLGYDLRTRLGISAEDISSGKKFELKVEKTGFWAQLFWYLSTKDPAVKVPAWLAFWSVLLGLSGFVLGVFSLIF